jgi:chromosome segregation ATPase
MQPTWSCLKPMTDTSVPEGARDVHAEHGVNRDSERTESTQLYSLIAQQADNVDRLVDRIALLSQHEAELRSIAEATREQLAARNSTLLSLQETLQRVEQERDQLRSFLREAMNEIESRDIAIDDLRRRLRKRKS